MCSIIVLPTLRLWVSTLLYDDVSMILVMYLSFISLYPHCSTFVCHRLIKYLNKASATKQKGQAYKTNKTKTYKKQVIESTFIIYKNIGHHLGTGSNKRNDPLSLFVEYIVVVNIFLCVNYLTYLV